MSGPISMLQPDAASPRRPPRRDPAAVDRDRRRAARRRHGRPGRPHAPAGGPAQRLADPARAPRDGDQPRIAGVDAGTADRSARQRARGGGGGDRLGGDVGEARDDAVLVEEARVQVARDERRAARAVASSRSTLSATPSIRVAASASASAATAAARSARVGDDFRQQRVVVRRDRACRRSTQVSTRTQAGSVERRRRVPLDGRKPASGSSAMTRASMAWPSKRTSSCANGSGSPAATRSCSSTRSRPVTASVTGCSTCRRALTSRKANAPSSSSRNSTVPALV